jgi:hypothetical protein
MRLSGRSRGEAVHPALTAIIKAVHDHLSFGIGKP